MRKDTSPKPSEFEAATGRDVAALLNPAPLSIIGARSPEGRIGFATVLWAMPISHAPAMTAIALRASSHTMGIIRETGRFSLSTLPADDEGVRIADACGKATGRKVDKASLVAHEVIDGLPVVAHSLSWELCDVESIREAGDHLLAVGTVARAATRASRDAKDRLAPTDTLLCIQHDTYAPVGTPLQESPSHQ